MKHKQVVSIVLVTSIVIWAFFMVLPIGGLPHAGEYNPWLDINDDGKIDMMDVGNVARSFMTSGTPLDKASIEYDSGWINITDKCGQYFNITHDLNSTDIIVDLTGKTNPSGGPHQMHYGVTVGLPKWSVMYPEVSADVFDYETAYSMVQTVDGGYALAGKMDSGSSGGPHGFVLLLKTDWTGKMQWDRILLVGELHGVYNDVRDVIQTSDEGYALAGYANESLQTDMVACLIKTDAFGNTQWIGGYGGIGGDSVNSVIQTSEGGYIIAGYTQSFGNSSDFYLVKTDDVGEVQWQKMHGGTDDEVAEDIIKTEDGGYALTGYTRSFGAGGADVYLVKTDSSGNMEWQRTYGMASNDYGYNVVQTSDGGYAISCSGFASLIKTDSNGNMEWNRQYSESGAFWVIETADEGYALAAGASLVKVDFNGNVQWIRDYGGYSRCVVETTDGAYACAGWKNTDDVWYTGHFWLARTETEFGLARTGSTVNTITLYRGATDPYWNFVRVRLWKPKIP